MPTTTYGNESYYESLNRRLVEDMEPFAHLTYCGMCGCTEHKYLGDLGHRAHYACRDCGATFSKVSQQEVDVWEDD